MLLRICRERPEKATWRSACELVQIYEEVGLGFHLSWCIHLPGFGPRDESWYWLDILKYMVHILWPVVELIFFITNSEATKKSQCMHDSDTKFVDLSWFILCSILFGPSVRFHLHDFGTKLGFKLGRDKETGMLFDFQYRNDVVSLLWILRDNEITIRKGLRDAEARNSYHWG